MKLPHIPILKVFDELKFNLGKKTLIDFLKGNPNSTIERNNLDNLNSYGSLYMLDIEEIEHLLDELIKNSYLQVQEIKDGFKVICRTPIGIKEIYEKKFVPNKLKSEKITSKIFNETNITDYDLKLFKTFDFFLKEYNDEQKKAIITQSSNVLCVAGAGSGKTTVLTKRIEFLTKFKTVSEKKILAITFTKKAKEEMQKRLIKLGVLNVMVETFNSFCEKVLKKRGDLIYKDKNVKVAQYKDKIGLVNWALSKLNIKFELFYDDYFSKKQIRDKTKDELFFIFVNDIFTILDYYKNKQEKISDFYKKALNMQNQRIAKIVYNCVNLIFEELKNRGLRDFSDQIIDCIFLYKKYPNLIPEFEHILIDEFQDLNLVQFELIKLLNSKNLFVVGDPRQAIYGWRGSDIKFILNFPEIFEKTEIISLKKNYRSYPQIVNLFNLAISSMRLVDLESVKKSDEEKRVFLIEHANENLEKIFVCEAIKNSKNKRCEIFVLARTNKILENYVEFFKSQGIDYLIKSEENYLNNQTEPKENQVVLATVHSIKGMEAKEVYIVSCNTLSFPNKVQDNFILSMVKEDNDYNKDQEELRLFYVALSRAKEKLVITYTGNYSKYITKQMLELIDVKNKNKSLFNFAENSSKNIDSSNIVVLKNMLKDWRAQKAANLGGLPVYMIISNETIEQLCTYLPQSKAELYNIKGLGELKIAKYGEEILKIICR